MRNSARWILAAVLLAAPAIAGDDLRTAYSAILRGDYVAGSDALSRIQSEGSADRSVIEAGDWLNSYLQLRDTRRQNRKETFDWHVKQAREALEQSNKPYLALSFAAQAANYAEDGAAFGREKWVEDLRARTLLDAKAAGQSGKWIRAHSYYGLLQRIYEDDAQIKELREDAARHARLELNYSDDETVERRLKGVNAKLLYNAVRIIDETYYERPDFRKMATGALDNIEALVTAEKLYDAAKVFNGIANPRAREHFLSRIGDQRRELENARNFEARHLIAMFKEIQKANAASVSLPEELLIVEFTDGALTSLDDYTSLVWPSEASEFDKYMMGNFYGVGIQLGIDEVTGRLKVATPLENSPSLKAGIQAGDIIDAVDGVSTKDWTTDRAVREITGKEGTVVTLTIFRPATGRHIDFPLTRSEIKLTTIRGVERLPGGDGTEWDYMIDKQAGIAYVRLTSFTQESAAELQRALESAKRQGMRGLIFDLRHNPGGLLNVAVDVVSEFLDSGGIVSTLGRREERERHEAGGGAEFPDLPLVVLVNEGSASASEIFAGALQDHARAVIIGERTFGKGSVQRVLSLEQRGFFAPPSEDPAARLKITTALYYLPSNRSPHKAPGAEMWGVDPDWDVPLTPKEFARVLERERDAYIIHNEDASKSAAKSGEAEETAKPEEEKVASALTEDEDEDDLLTTEDIKLLRSDPFEAPNIDPQLETALLHLRVKLAGDLPWPAVAKKESTQPMAQP